MNPEQLKVALVILQFLFIAGVVAWMVHKSRLFQCPQCRASVPVAKIRMTEITCSKCGWRLERSPLNRTLPASAGLRDVVCHQCCQAPAEATLVELWDGNFYCEMCLNEAHPKLAEYAKSHTALAESAPFSLARAIWGAFCLATLVAAMIAGAFTLIGIAGVLILGFQGQLPAKGFQALTGFVLAVGMMFAFAWAFVGLIAFPLSLATHWFQRPRMVSVTEGHLTIKPPGDRFYDLATIRWAEATSRFDPVDCMCWPRKRGIVLFPHRGDEQSQYRTQKVGYIVGLTPDMFSLWKAFLTLARVPIQQIRPWKPIEYPRP